MKRFLFASLSISWINSGMPNSKSVTSDLTFPIRALMLEAGNAHVQTGNVFKCKFLIHFIFLMFSSCLYFRKSACSLALHKRTGIMSFQPQTTCSNTSVYSEHGKRTCPTADTLWPRNSQCYFLSDKRKVFSIFIILGTLEKHWSFSFFFPNTNCKTKNTVPP